MVGEAASPTNPKKGCAGKHRKQYSDRLKDAYTRDHKCTNTWPRMNLRLVL